MLIVSPTTVLNPAAVETRQVPRRFLGRALILPRGAGAADLLRFLFEMQSLRYAGALLPFLVAMAIWPHLALPIAQAPLFMVIAIGFVELRLLRLDEAARERIASEDEAARTLDALRFRATRTLRRLAARKGLAEGELSLVVEQSELARIRPLTLVSVQRDGARPEVLALDAEDLAEIAGFFDAAFTERDLQRANLHTGEFLRTTGFDARGVSAHARLAARIRAAEGAA